jgi:hypothetical protein
MNTLCILALMTALATPAVDDNKIGFDNSDTVADVLSRQVGQRVEVRLKCGGAVDGIIEVVGDKMVLLSRLAGREVVFQAVVVLDDITTVVIRTAK